MIAQPIDSAPKDRNILLRFPGNPFTDAVSEPFWIEGYWFSSPKEIDDGWETEMGSLGEPTLWAELPTIIDVTKMAKITHPVSGEVVAYCDVVVQLIKSE